MHIHDLTETPSVLNHFLSQIRDVSVQNDSMRFRRNIERIGEVMALEMSKGFDYNPVEIQTPLGIKQSSRVADKIVLCSILRAGLPLHLGFLNYFDDAENGFVSAYRHYPEHDNDYFDILVEYQAIPDINDKSLLLVDPMLATGQSMVAVYNKLLQRGTPKSVHIAVVIAAPEGIDYLEKHLSADCHLWIASRDEKLNEHSYIIPGLGDAGDLAYGSKL
ncbi:MAG TPA: uracil phosphoribosyltransferase [Flavobacterium sp.]|jgi:uracil phosphoribosyltransferase